ncbi:MAG: ATP-grasp fold amidoligase family protein, partial [Pseudomonadota bacterium]
IAPRGFSEKLIVAKLFAPIPLPSPGDKLGLDRYIPADWCDRVRTARRVWISSYPEAPTDVDAPPGRYFFKANHASGLNIPVSLPLPEGAEAKLAEAAEKFLAHDYGARGGEWWYQAIHRKVYLEESFAPAGGSATDWKFFVIGGRVEIVQVDLDRAEDHKQLIYDRDFDFLPYEFFYPSGRPIDPPANYGEMLEAAEAIGARFEFARVDFYNTDDGIVLGEITLAPGGARQRIRSPELDERMGAAWATPLFAGR